jgi:hypothetical protein
MDHNMPQDQCTGFAQYVDDNNIDGLQQTNKNGKHPHSFFTMDTVQRATSSKKRIEIFFYFFGWAEPLEHPALSIRAGSCLAKSMHQKFKKKIDASANYSFQTLQPEIHT